MNKNVLILLSVLVIALFIIGCRSEEVLEADEDLTEEDIALLSEEPEDDGAIAGQAVGVPTTVEMGNLVNGKLEIMISPGSKGVYKRMWLYFNNKYTAYVNLCDATFCFDSVSLDLAPGDFIKSKVTEFVPGTYKIKLYPKDTGRPKMKFFGPFDVVEGASAPFEVEEVETCVPSESHVCFQEGSAWYYKNKTINVTCGITIEQPGQWCGYGNNVCLDDVGCCKFEQVSTSCLNAWELVNLTKSSCTGAKIPNQIECDELGANKICYDKNVEANCYTCGQKICELTEDSYYGEKGDFYAVGGSCWGSMIDTGEIVNGSACPGYIE